MTSCLLQEVLVVILYHALPFFILVLFLLVNRHFPLGNIAIRKSAKFSDVSEDSVRSSDRDGAKPDKSKFSVKSAQEFKMSWDKQMYKYSNHLVPIRFLFRTVLRIVELSVQNGLKNCRPGVPTYQKYMYDCSEDRSRHQYRFKK